MVSGRHKAYKPAESAGDSLANDTSARAFSLELKVIKDARVNKRNIVVEGERFSRRAIDNLADSTYQKKSFVPSLIGYTGEKPEPVEANGNVYIGLMKLKSGGGCMNFILYDFSDNKVKRARTRLEKKAIEQKEAEQEGRDFEYDDLVDKLVNEYRQRK